MRITIIAVWMTAAILFCWSVPLSFASLNDGLVVHYPFGSETNPETENGNVHGTSLVSDRSGTSDAAFNFDGMDDWVGIEDFDCELDYNHDWSVNIWVYRDAAGRHAAFFAGADGDSGAKQFVLASKYVKVTHKADTDSDWRVNFKEASSNSWHMYTATWSKSGQLKVYVDGVLKGEDAVGELDDFCPDNAPIVGAVNFMRKTQFFKGSIDDFRIYDRVLSDLDIKGLFTLVD